MKECIKSSLYYEKLNWIKTTTIIIKFTLFRYFIKRTTDCILIIPVSVLKSNDIKNQDSPLSAASMRLLCAGARCLFNRCRQRWLSDWFIGLRVKLSVYFFIIYSFTMGFDRHWTNRSVWSGKTFSVVKAMIQMSYKSIACFGSAEWIVSVWRCSMIFIGTACIISNICSHIQNDYNYWIKTWNGGYNFNKINKIIRADYIKYGRKKYGCDE